MRLSLREREEKKNNKSKIIQPNHKEMFYEKLGRNSRFGSRIHRWMKMSHHGHMQRRCFFESGHIIAAHSRRYFKVEPINRIQIYLPPIHRNRKRFLLVLKLFSSVHEHEIKNCHINCVLLTFTNIKCGNVNETKNCLKCIQFVFFCCCIGRARAPKPWHNGIEKSQSVRWLNKKKRERNMHMDLNIFTHLQRNWMISSYDKTQRRKKSINNNSQDQKWKCFSNWIAVLVIS